MLTPAARFRKNHPEDAGKLAEVTGQRWFEFCVDTALAEMAARGQVESIPGANEFVKVFMSLHAETTPTATMPDPHLQSYDKEIDLRRGNVQPTEKK